MNRFQLPTSKKYQNIKHVNNVTLSQISQIIDLKKHMRAR